MKLRLRTALGLAAVAIATQAVAQVTFYENDNFRGRTFTTSRQIPNFDRFGFNDRASSVVVKRDRWEVCEDVRFNGRCVILRPGQYPSLAAMGLNDRVSSVRTVGRNMRIEEDRYAPMPVSEPDYRRHDNERLYQARVIEVRAVVGPPEQRCWVEREQVVQERGGANVPGAVAGALIGGILGHQVGGGTGKDLATAGGAVAGAAIGANVGRDGTQHNSTQNIRRCETTQRQTRPEVWDVTYEFRGQQHHVQLTAPPGRTIAVNNQGEPRK